MIGVHWGRIPKETKKTGGCLFNQKVSRHIEAWLDQAETIPLKQGAVAVMAKDIFELKKELGTMPESAKSSSKHLRITGTCLPHTVVTVA